MYTNGDLIDTTRLHDLQKAGCDEIRFNLSAPNYDLGPVELACRMIETVAVEIPAIPEDYETVRKLLPDIQKIEVRHLNLHQISAWEHNYRELARRGYRSHHLLNPAAIHLIEIIFLGEVLSFWLERQGIPALHASAVLIGGRAVAFLSSNQGGKSGLAATLMQSGHPLLTDDILPVEEHNGVFLGRPGYPTMRMWPDEAAYFLGAYEHLPLVHPELSKRRVPVGGDGFGSFCDTSQPLACIYLPERRDASGASTTSEISAVGHPGRHPSQPDGAVPNTDVEILPVSPRDAVIELIRHSFSAHQVEAAGLAPQRLNFFARLAQKVPMRRLIYPASFEHLPRVREAILGDQ